MFLGKIKLCDEKFNLASLVSVFLEVIKSGFSDGNNVRQSNTFFYCLYPVFSRSVYFRWSDSDSMIDSFLGLKYRIFLFKVMETVVYALMIRATPASFAC